MIQVYSTVKRSLDILFSGIIIAALFWLMLACAIIIKANEPSAPIMYNRTRIGKKHKPFTLYKFRTMPYKGTDEIVIPQADSLNRVGKFMRKYSLDELPQLFNIFIGDMSIVGPRPLLPEYLDYYTYEENKRHNVRPGLTGLAQINGRANLDWDSRFKLDIEYVTSRSFLLDTDIFFKTIIKTFKGDDSIPDGSDISLPFHIYRMRMIESARTKKEEVLLNEKGTLRKGIVNHE